MVPAAPLPFAGTWLPPRCPAPTHHTVALALRAL